MARQSLVAFRIISGGQTGADQGGLLAARTLHIPTRGTAPQGWITEVGPQEQLLRGFGLVECSEPGYDSRTRWNVLAADGTLLLGSYTSGGSALTAKIATDAKKPFFHVPFPTDPETLDDISAAFLRWLSEFKIHTLNVAGNRESQNPGLQEFTRNFLISALRTMKTTYREANLSDLQAIADFQIAMAQETEQLGLDRQVCTQGVLAVLNNAHLGRYYVCEMDGSVVASTLITYEWSDWRNGLVWWIQSVYVVPSARKKGVYAGLYQHLQSLAQEDKNIRGIRLYVDRRNIAAQQVYTKLGMNGEHYQVFEWMKEF